MRRRRVAVVLGLAGLFVAGAALGARGAQRPLVRGRLAWQGRERTYGLLVPAAPRQPAPLVLVLHGGGGTGDGMRGLTQGRLDALAERDGWLVAYPDGLGRGWNDGRDGAHDRAHREGIDDVGFLGALVDALVRERGADPRRVYATGASNGAMMTLRLALESGRLAAAAPVMGALPEALAGHAGPAQPVPLLAITGEQDPLVPWRGGEVVVFGRSRGRVRSADDTARAFAAWNRCAAEPEVERLPDADPDDGTRVRRERFAPREDGAEVVHLVVEGGGHTWPGGAPYLPRRLIGRTSREIDACEELWRFFGRHARPR